MPESVQPARAASGTPGTSAGSATVPQNVRQNVRPNVTVTGVALHGHRPVRPALVIAVFCLGLFMTLLDITIVNIAIPDLVTDLDATLETVLWVGSAYSLVYTVLLITAGRLGDIHGPRRLFLVGLTIFTAASLASGLSQTPCWRRRGWRSSPRSCRRRSAVPHSRRSASCPASACCSGRHWAGSW